jgi:predicted deacylase
MMTVMSGMHAGEYSGILAAQKLISEVNPEELSGTLLVIPVISTRAFMAGDANCLQDSTTRES